MDSPLLLCARGARPRPRRHKQRVWVCVCGPEGVGIRTSSNTSSPLGRWLVCSTAPESSAGSATRSQWHLRSDSVVRDIRVG